MTRTVYPQLVRRMPQPREMSLLMRRETLRMRGMFLLRWFQ